MIIILYAESINRLKKLVFLNENMIRYLKLMLKSEGQQ